MRKVLPPSAHQATFSSVEGLSERFCQAISDYYGSVGRRWLERLDVIVERHTERWNLKPTGERPVTGGRSLVLPCHDQKGRAVVLKLCPDPYTLGRERDGLRHWASSGRTVRVLRGSGGRGAMVLERLPQAGPSNLDDDVLAEIAELIDAIHEVPNPLPALSCEQHVAALMALCIGRLSDEFVQRFVSTDDLKTAVDRALSLAVSRPIERDVLLHGDLHLENLMRKDSGHLTAIDPKPFIGERELELALLVRGAGPIYEIEGRITRMAAACGADGERLRAWTRVLLLETAISHARWRKSSSDSIAAMVDFCRTD